MHYFMRFPFAFHSLSLRFPFAFPALPLRCPCALHALSHPLSVRFPCAFPALSLRFPCDFPAISLCFPWRPCAFAAFGAGFRSVLVFLGGVLFLRVPPIVSPFRFHMGGRPPYLLGRFNVCQDGGDSIVEFSTLRIC